MGNKHNKQSTGTTLSPLVASQNIMHSSYPSFSSKNAYLFSCGLNNSSQLGRGPDNDSGLLLPVDTSSMLNHMNSIVKVSCGGYFSVVLLSDHRVFSVGENSFAECGFSNNEARIGYYRHVKEADECNVVDINCGYHFTVFTGVNGEIYHCGEINGADHNKSQIIVKNKGIDMKEVIQVEAGGYVAAFLHTSRKTFKIIRNNGDPHNPTEINPARDSPIAKLCVSYTNILLLCDDGSIHISDSSEAGMLFSRIQTSRPVIQLQTSYYHYYYQRDDYVICRDNDNGKLLTENKINGPVDISCGGYHVFLKNLNDKKVWFCGENTYHEGGFEGGGTETDVNLHLIDVKSDALLNSSLELFAAHGMGCFSYFWIGSSKDFTVLRAFPKLKHVLDKFNDIEILSQH